MMSSTQRLNPGARCYLCRHMHTNPFQLIELPEENLQPGCSYSDWFEAGDFQASKDCCFASAELFRVRAVWWGEA